jgi:hypothetical protein
MSDEVTKEEAVRVVANMDRVIAALRSGWHEIYKDMTAEELDDARSRHDARRKTLLKHPLPEKPFEMIRDIEWFNEMIGYAVIDLWFSELVLESFDEDEP